MAFFCKDAVGRLRDYAEIPLRYKGEGARHGDFIPVRRFDLAYGVAVILVLEDNSGHGAGNGLLCVFIWQKILLHIS